MSRLTNTDVVILCGGLGQRLRSVIGENQKVMAPVNNEPFLNVLLKDLAAQGGQRIILCTGYKADTVENYYRRNNLGLQIEFSPEEEPLGTGGAVKNARNLIKSNPFVVMNGDSFCPLDYKKFFQFFLTKKALLAIAIYKADAHKDFGLLTIDDQKVIKKFYEKAEVVQGAAYLNAGVYVGDQEIFKLMPKGRKFSLEQDFFPMLTDKSFFGFEVAKPFVDIGQPERFVQAEQLLKRTK